MTAELRRLVALAAVLAPARAGRLLARLAVPGADLAMELASALAAAPRRVRLAALAAALPGPAAAPRAAPSHPLLRRLALEASVRPAAARAPVHATAGSRSRAPSVPGPIGPARGVK